MSEPETTPPTVPTLPQYVDTHSFVHPKQQKPLLKLLSRMLKPHVVRHARLPKRTKKKHQVKFY